MTLYNKGNKSYSLIVPSLGRCGSTLLFKALLAYFKNGFFIQNMEDVKFKKSYVYKTHCYAPDKVGKNIKAVFLFGNPFNTVLSAHDRRVNIKAHYKHFETDYSQRSNYEDKDTLNLEKHFDSWVKKQTFPLLIVRYETLYDNIEIISNFLNINLQLPCYRTRKVNWEVLNKNKKQKIMNTYGNLYKKINNCPDIKIWE